MTLLMLRRAYIRSVHISGFQVFNIALDVAGFDAACAGCGGDNGEFADSDQAFYAALGDREALAGLFVG